MLPFIEVFGLQVDMYALLATVGLIVCVVCALCLTRRYKTAVWRVLLLFVATGAGMFIGGHLLYLITRLEAVSVSLSELESVGFSEICSTVLSYAGGMVFYGGFLGGLAGAAVYSHFDRTMHPCDMLDVYAVCVPLFHFFGRLGCFCAGCCYGIESKFGFTVHGNTNVYSVNDVNRFPVSLLEAAGNLMLFLLLLWLFNRKKLQKNLIFVYMLVYSVLRFMLEFLRGDLIRGIWFGLSTSQWISILLFAVAAVGLIKRKTE